MSAEILQLMMPRAKRLWCDAIMSIAPKWGIDTPVEIVTFTAQWAVETDEFTLLRENLNYTPQGILDTFNRYRPRFTREQAMLYGRTPEHPANQEMIANIAYANYLGNGPPESGDGFFYRGHGPPQLTFHDNYRDFENASGHQVLANPELLLEPEIGIACACWYWKTRGIDRHDDDADARAERRAVNGGEHGLAKCQTYLDTGLRLAREHNWIT